MYKPSATRRRGLTEIEERVDMPEAQVRTAILRSESGLKLELIERAIGMAVRRSK